MKKGSCHDYERQEFLGDAVFATEEEAGSVYPVAAAYRKWTFFGETLND